MKAAGVEPDLLISSPAVRALTTAQIIAGELDYPDDAIRLEERLYGAGPATMIEVLSETDDEIGHVMFFSHNPGITEFVNRIAGAGTDNMPTCGVARMEFDVASWNNLHGAKALLIDLDYPKRPAG